MVVMVEVAVVEVTASWAMTSEAWVTVVVVLVIGVVRVVVFVVVEAGAVVMAV